MMNELTPLVKPILELGVTGLLFIMWWFERQDRINTVKSLDRVTSISSSFENMSKEMIQCIKDNTTATVKLLERMEQHEENLTAPPSRRK